MNFTALGVALCAVISAGLVVNYAPQKDWRVGIPGFIAAVLFAWLGVWLAT